jgi:hypothetical protein
MRVSQNRNNLEFCDVSGNFVISTDSQPYIAMINSNRDLFNSLVIKSNNKPEEIYNYLTGHPTISLQTTPDTPEQSKRDKQFLVDFVELSNNYFSKHGNIAPLLKKHSDENANLLMQVNQCDQFSKGLPGNITALKINFSDGYTQIIIPTRLDTVRGQPIQTLYYYDPSKVDGDLQSRQIKYNQDGSITWSKLNNDQEEFPLAFVEPMLLENTEVKIGEVARGGQADCIIARRIEANRNIRKTYTEPAKVSK